MFQWLFKYPIPVFTKGRFLLLGTWPGWLLAVFILLGAVGLFVLIRIRLRDAAPNLRTWRAGVLWGLQAATLALVLTLLWQPAMVVSELSSQQNIIAVVVDDSHSMGTADSDGKTREAAAIKALQDGMLAGLQKRFQTRVYRLGSGLAQIEKPEAITPADTSTHIGAGLKQLVAETSDLPVGAVVFLSDGSENGSGTGGAEISADAL